MEPPDFEEAIDDFRTILIIGGTDTGKSSLVQLLTQFYRSRGERVIHVDLDMGQSTIGPPTTIGLAAPNGMQCLYFTGNITPYGIFGEIKHGVRRFRETINSLTYDRVVVDTPGLVHDDFAWNLARMELTEIKGDFVVLLDRAGETARIAEGLTTLGVPFHIFRPSVAGRKSYAKRTTYRKKLFLDYFEEASTVKVVFKGRKIIHLGKQEEPGLLVGLLSSSEFLLSLGIVMAVEKEGVIVAAHASRLEETAIIKFGRYSMDEWEGLKKKRGGEPPLFV